MSLPLAGKVALVTGSSRGIGAAIARKLANDGAFVVVNYSSNYSAARTVVDSINEMHPNTAIDVKADLTNLACGRELLDKTIEAFGKLDILVLNAGIMGSRSLVDVDEKFFDEHFLLNVKAPLFLVKAAAPLLPEGGRIIFMSTSITKATTILPNTLTYAASKGAVEQFTRALAKDLGSRQITVNTVSPGPTDTELFRNGKSEQLIQALANLNPQKRIPPAEEIVPIVAFLASPGASWINGQNICVNGAFTV